MQLWQLQQSCNRACGHQRKQRLQGSIESVTTSVAGTSVSRALLRLLRAPLRLQQSCNRASASSAVRGAIKGVTTSVAGTSGSSSINGRCVWLTNSQYSVVNSVVNSGEQGAPPLEAGASPLEAGAFNGRCVWLENSSLSLSRANWSLPPPSLSLPPRSPSLSWPPPLAPEPVSRRASVW